jgi:hypothetical protein
LIKDNGIHDNDASNREEGRGGALLSCKTPNTCPEYETPGDRITSVYLY